MFRELSFEELDQVAGGDPPYGDPGYNSNGYGAGGWATSLADMASFSGGVYFSAQAIADHKEIMGEIASLLGSLGSNDSPSYAPLGSDQSYGQVPYMPGDITVRGEPFLHSGYGFMPISSFGDSGSTGQDNLATPTSAAANAFADAHVKNEGTSAADQKWFDRVHDDLAKFFDYANAHPSDLINIGHGQTVSFSRALADTFHAKYVITDNPALTTTTINGVTTDKGAVTSYDGLPDDPMAHTIYIEPNSQAMQGHDAWGAIGEDYVVFHELGHDLEFAELSGYYSGPSAENAADTVANSIESQLGLTSYPNPPSGAYG